MYYYLPLIICVYQRSINCFQLRESWNQFDKQYCFKLVKSMPEKNYSQKAQFVSEVQLV